ncbi:MAG: gamma carbonic anhydrase family protein [Deltaproteobacteria bacterium]|nr:MAG: gamma carbonic anhydrase family protein [Deltaproteobacteria bacterium]
MDIIKFREILPKLGKRVFIAKGARIIGNTEIGDDSAVWFNTVIRGDTAKITIGKNTNIQDNSVLHCDPDSPLTIGNNVTIGHNAIVHGCTIEDNVMIGMGAIVMNDAVIRKNSIVAAGSVVLEKTEVPEYSLIAGSPAKIKKELAPATGDVIRNVSKHYVELKDNYIESEDKK